MISGFRLKDMTSLPAIETVELCTFRNAPVFLVGDILSPSMVGTGKKKVKRPCSNIRGKGRRSIYSIS